MYKQGFTLLEVIIYMSLLSCMLITLTSSSFQLLELTEKNNQQSEAESNGNFVVRKFITNLRSGIPLYQPSSNNSTPLTNLKITYAPISSTNYLTTISFSIFDHYFLIQQLLHEI